MFKFSELPTDEYNSSSSKSFARDSYPFFHWDRLGFSAGQTRVLRETWHKRTRRYPLHKTNRHKAEISEEKNLSSRVLVVRPDLQSQWPKSIKRYALFAPTRDSEIPAPQNANWRDLPKSFKNRWRDGWHENCAYVRRGKRGTPAMTALELFFTLQTCGIEKWIFILQKKTAVIFIMPKNVAIPMNTLTESTSEHFAA